MAVCSAHRFIAPTHIGLFEGMSLSCLASVRQVDVALVNVA